MQLLFSFEQDMRVEKALIQTVACQLSSTLMQLLFSFDQDMKVTHPCDSRLTAVLLYNAHNQQTNLYSTFINLWMSYMYTLK